jgi:UPF0755 protein
VLKVLVRLAVAAGVSFALWMLIYANFPARLGADPIQFSVKQGSSLRSAAAQMDTAGILGTPRQFELLARLLGEASRVQAGNYEVGGTLTHLALLRKITSGEHGQDKITFVEGATFVQIRAALGAHPAVKHNTDGMNDSAVLRALAIQYPSGEGLFFPDTYYFSNGTSDLAILKRAHRMMLAQLEMLWEKRAPELPLAEPYQALILASIIEKESGQPNELPLIAAVFVNRLKLGMLLQTDPTVIYGLGERFDGNLRKRDLLADGPYNTYVRPGLPPTPIAMPGYAALEAALTPAQSKALYFVARGDGTSHFSTSLAEHGRAVTKYQKQGSRRQ